MSRMCNLYVSTIMRKHILYSLPFSFAFLIVQNLRLYNSMCVAVILYSSASFW